MLTSDIIFAVRGEFLIPQFYKGSASYGLIGGNPSVITEASAIGGKVIDFGNPLVSAGALYQGNKNTPVGSSFSIVMSVILYGTASNGFFSMGSGTSNRYGDFAIYITGSLLKVYFKNEVGYVGMNSLSVDISAAATFDGSTINDIVVTFTGDTTASGCKVYVDGVLIGSVTSSRAYTTPIAQGVKQAINLGITSQYHQSNFYLQECIVVEGIIDPTANIPLVSGDGLLNGAARTSYVALPALNPDTFPDVSKVLDTESWVESEVTKTGTIGTPITFPDETKVLDTESWSEFGVTETGELGTPTTFPDVSKVLDTESWTEFGVAKTGTLSGDNTFPDPAGVLDTESWTEGGTPNTGTIGTPITFPDETKVLDTETWSEFGVDETGEIGTPTTFPSANSVLDTQAWTEFGVPKVGLYSTDEPAQIKFSAIKIDPNLKIIKY